MSKTLTIDDSTARKIYPTAAPELKAILEETYSAGFFSQKITDRIKTFEDACEYNNTNPKARRFTIGTRNQIYQERVAEIVKALNEGWLADYNDSNYKYSPYFYLNKPGFRFHVSCYGFAASGSTGGPRFALKNRELSDYAGQQFVKEYEQWLMPDSGRADGQKIMRNAIADFPFSGDMKAWEKHIMGIVKSFEDACARVGEDPYDEKFFYGEPDDIGYQKGKVICKALNGAYHKAVIDPKNKEQKKWYVWMEHDGTGFRFHVSCYVFAASSSNGGPRLRLCSEVLAKYFFEQFGEVMTPYWG
jgi:hypothetical protein